MKNPKRYWCGELEGNTMKRITVGENENEMRDLALIIMRDNYRAADNAAKNSRLEQASKHLAAAERWRVRARLHGAKI